MNGLRISHKFGVLALIYLVAIGTVGLMLYGHLSSVVVTSQAKLDGLQEIKPLLRTIQLLQQHRGLSGGVLGGNPGMRETLAENEREAIASFQALNKQTLMHASHADDWLRVQSGWTAIRSTGLRWSASENFSAHTLLLDQLRTLQRRAADRAALSFDPDIDAHYLLDTAIVQLPQALEVVAQIRGLGTNILAKKSITPAQTAQMQALLTELKSANKHLTGNWEAVARYNPAVRNSLNTAFMEYTGPLTELVHLVQSDVLQRSFATSPDDYFNLSTVAIDKGYQQLFQTLQPTAETLIRARLQVAKNDIYVSAAIALALLSVAVYLFAGIYRSTVDSIQSLAQAAQKFAAGDLSARVQLSTHDEIAQVGDSFNHMADGFAALLTARQEDEGRLRAIVNSALDAVIQMDASGRISGWNPQAEAIFGWSHDEAMGRNLHETIIPERYRARHLQGLKHLLATGVGPVLNSRVEVEGLHRNGHEFPIELAISSTKTAQGTSFSAFVRDISARRRSEAELRIAAVAFESDDGIVITDKNGTALNVNHSFTKITGYSSEEIVGQSPFILQAGRRDESEFLAMWKALADENAWQGEIWSRRKNGEEYPEWIRINAVSNEAGHITNYVVAFSDISQRKKFEETIHKLAFYDPLTNLPNRRLLRDRLQQRMSATSRSEHHGALLMIDLDHFKTLNDTRGHEIGNLLLLEVTQRLSNCVREDDTVARLGGDEFMVLLGLLSVEVEEAANQTEVVCAKVLATLGQTYQLGGLEHRNTASIGVTLFRGTEMPTDELLQQAELAMYQVKESGRDGFRFFDAAMQTAVSQRVALEAGLRLAIDGQQLVLHYQAQVLGDGRVTGAEALVRWQHPTRGMVSPAEFIPLAEETGLILPLGNWVLQTACDQLAAWALQPEMAQLSLAVNVSAHQFREANFVDTVLVALARSGAQPGRLKLELTESLLVDNVDDIIQKMHALKAKGVGFSLDDFGTGYSSLTYLKRLPLDQLKIDQSFVRNILLDPNDAAIAKTVVALAQSLGLGVIAEGVETEPQRDFLFAAGCVAYQGYFFSRPLAIAGFETYVRNALERV